MVTGYLPPGIHYATQDVFAQAFGGYCEATPFNFERLSHRRKLYSGYARLVEMLENTGLTARQWVGGSFVTNKAVPSDVDVVNFCDVQRYESLSSEARKLLDPFFQGKKTAQVCYCDSYFAPTAQLDHPNRVDFDVIAAYWHTTFGHDRAGRAKGIVAPMVDAEKALKILTEHIDAAVS